MRGVDKDRQKQLNTISVMTLNLTFKIINISKLSYKKTLRQKFLTKLANLSQRPKSSCLSYKMTSNAGIWKICKSRWMKKCRRCWITIMETPMNELMINYIQAYLIVMEWYLFYSIIIILNVDLFLFFTFLWFYET